MELRGQKLTLDGAEVERLGGLCLQVLIAARNQWRVDGVDFQIVNPSPAFRDGARLMAAEDVASQGDAP
jgi:chemotaxis protein CheX